MTYGIDVSHHQKPHQVPWATIAKTSSFCICRTSYGAQLRDREVGNHMREAHEHGLKVGVYHFFRVIHSAVGQFQLFKSVVEDVGGCQPGDIVPFVDIERDPMPSPGTEVSPSWSAPARDLVERIANEYGACGVYITQREFKMLGSPDWVLQHPLWVAHYTKGTPASPAGVLPHIHQHRVGPYDPNGPGGYFTNNTNGLVLDQNRALQPLPLLVEYSPEKTSPAVPTPRNDLPTWIGPPELGLPSDAWDELSEQRRGHNLEKK
jgi:hypothetical protein